MLLTTATHTEGPVSPAGVSPTLACEEEAGYKAWPLHERWPFSATFSHLLPREPLEAFLGVPQIGPRTDNNDKANGIFVRCETLQAGCRPEPPSDGMCRLPIPPKTRRAGRVLQAGRSGPHHYLGPLRTGSLTQSMQQACCSPHRPGNPTNCS